MKSIPEEIINFYSQGKEAGRLGRGIGPLEFTRTKELILRHILPPPAVVADIGGGPGTYSCWLADLGYQAHLVDITPLHIEQARVASTGQENPIATLAVGDARALPFVDEFADVVLLHGPLYHLTDKSDRLKTLCEAKRILKPGGLLLAFGITRYSSGLVGIVNGWIHDASYLSMVEKELSEGIHIRPENWNSLFTTAYFHYAAELKAEIEEAGFHYDETFAVEGPGWLVKNFDEYWASEDNRSALLHMVNFLEKDPVAVGISPHILVSARSR